ncbi:MAG: AraC family transcriptional regulator [Segetibacter sp.]|nr:AraC family transcriptional regulator [Segetibacter sp.]
MVCGRCIKVVQNVLSELHLPASHVSLGKIHVVDNADQQKIDLLRVRLEEEGFELLDDQKVKLVEQIKNLIIQLVHYSNLEDWNLNLSAYLTDELHRDYNYLSHLFSTIEITTIEQFFILQKIEKVKEWLVYNQFTLSEMAYKLGYSSVAHLSSQFKKITGFTPSDFKQLKDHHRKPLDQV